MNRKNDIKNTAPAPAAYEATRQDAKRNGTSSVSMREIDCEIATVRKAKGKRRSSTPAA